MTEAEWLACGDPLPMLEYVRRNVSDRKLRWFSVACCRLVWPLLEQIGRQTVEFTEKYADGQATAEEQAKIENLAWWGADGLNYEEDPIWFAAWAAHQAVEGNAIETAALVAKATKNGGEVRCDLLRDVVGNPFRSTAVEPFWLTPGVVKLAQTIYDERAFNRLPELVVALEGAGCHDADILAHCRHRGPHVRGCWVVDLILGKS